MANVTLHRNPESRVGSSPYFSTPSGGWEPLGLLADFLFDPFYDMRSTSVDDRESFMPAFEVRDAKDGYTLRADLPGVALPELDISVTGNQLTISGKREQEQEDKGTRYYQRERVYGSFSRTFTMPRGADLENIKAELRDGVLNVTVPKKPELAPRKVKVNGKIEASAGPETAATQPEATPAAQTPEVNASKQAKA